MNNNVNDSEEKEWEAHEIMQLFIDNSSVFEPDDIIAFMGYFSMT